MLADLVFVAAQEGPSLWTYDWDIDKAAYIDALRHYDRTRDEASLVALVPLLRIE